MNNRVQQRFDRGVREALAHTKRLADVRHAEGQAYAEDAVRAAPLPAERSPRRVVRLSEADKLRAYDAGVRHPMIGEEGADNAQ